MTNSDIVHTGTQADSVQKAVGPRQNEDPKDLSSQRATQSPSWLHPATELSPSKQELYKLFKGIKDSSNTD